MARARIFREITFEAAHFLPNVPEGHKCRRVHGHSWRVIIECEGPVTDMGWVCDFADLDYHLKVLHGQLDHRTLNEVSGLENPTSENLAVWIWRALEQAAIPRLRRVTVMESVRGGAIYEGEV